MTLLENPLASEMLEAIEADLRQTINQFAGEAGQELVAMIAHHLGWSATHPGNSGKRIRPLITLLVCSACGADWHHALPAATSAECIHNFSLIHDDIQDRSDTRRGRPTVWKLWGEAQAINAGDALYALSRLASQRLSECGIAAHQILMVQRDFDQACLQLTRGQHLDLAFETRGDTSPAEYLDMIEAKTASLLAACASAGARVAQASEPGVQSYRTYARHLGVAFQIRDDVLGIWGDPQVTGKPARDDLLAHKQTFPVLCGLERSAAFRELWLRGEKDPPALQAMVSALEAEAIRDAAEGAAQEHTQLALGALEEVQPQGAAGQALYQLSQALLGRQR